VRRTSALIVGGGPAGASAAILLARAGIPHLLLERSRETGDALCGGFLSWRTLDALASLGIEREALRPGCVSHVRLFAGKAVAEARLPHPAIGVSRYRLDSLLIDRAIRAGAMVERGVGVRAIEDRCARLQDGADLQADTLFLACGKHDIRGMARPAEARGDDPALGLRLRLAPAPALFRMVGTRIELHLFDRGYMGIVLQEDGSANCCMAVHRSRLTEAGNPERLLDRLAIESPRLGERLALRRGSETIDAVANVPYGWRAGKGVPGLFKLGDQAGVIPSLAGEGMGIAIASGIRAAAAYRRGGADAAIGFQHRLYRDLALPIGMADRIRGLAERPRIAAHLVPVARNLPFLIDVVARLTRITHSRLDRTDTAQES